jgi:hypothetical protein
LPSTTQPAVERLIERFSLDPAKRMKIKRSDREVETGYGSLAARSIRVVRPLEPKAAACPQRRACLNSRGAGSPQLSRSATRSLAAAF